MAKVKTQTKTNIKSNTKKKKELSKDRLIWIFTQMVRIREFEERVKRAFIEHPGVIRGHTHLADGAEASIVGALATRNGWSSSHCHSGPLFGPELVGCHQVAAAAWDAWVAGEWSAAKAGPAL